MKEQLKYPFEKNVLTYASVLGLIISIIEVIKHLKSAGLNIDFYVDAGFVLLFAFVLTAIQLRISFRWILIFFYFPLTILLVLAFYANKGLAESSEYNIYVGLIFMIFTLKGKLPFYFSLALLFGVILSVALLELQFSFTDNYIDQHASDLNFILSSLGIIGFTYYAKHTLVKGRDELKENKRQLEIKSEELKQKRDELEEQKTKLEELTIVIDKRVSERTQDLQNQRKRKEEYLSIISSELNANFEQTIGSIKQIDEKSLDQPFFEMLQKSAESLKKEMSLLKKKVIEGND